MKKLILTFTLVLFSLFLTAQTSEKRNNFSFGGGKESYNGDLGNSWFNPKEEWYGFFRIGYNRFLNNSFDVISFVNYGDYGHCLDDEDPRLWPDGSSVMNMHARMSTISLGIRYKFANGYFMKADSKIAPYVSFGGAINNLMDIWSENHNRVNSGDYFSLNGGIGVAYNFCEKYSFNYHLGFGYFTSDGLDNRTEGRNDMYMQHGFTLGMNF